MKEYIITDNIQALTGMQLVGVDGVLIDEETKFEDAFRAVLADDTIGVLMISPQLIASHQKQVDDVRFNRSKPLIVEIQGPAEYAHSQSSIQSTIQSAIGISI